MKQTTAPSESGGDGTSPWKTLYPDVASLQDPADPSHFYRLQEITRVKERLEDDRDNRYHLYI